MDREHELFGFLRRSGIRRQLYTISALTVFLPVVLIGVFLVGNTYKLLTSYHRDLLESDNLRVRTILFEITTQAYNISEELSFDKDVIAVLRRQYSTEEQFVETVNNCTAAIDNYMYHYTEIERIDIYCDNPDIRAYKQYHGVDGEISGTDWYQRATSQAGIFWQEMASFDEHGNQYWGLCLVRRIPLVYSDYNAVLVIRLSDNYLKTRINSQEYRNSVSVDEGVVFYASDREDYGKPQLIDIDYSENYFQYAGKKKIKDHTCFVEVSTLRLYQSDSRLYICTINDKSYDNIWSIIQTCLIIILLAIVVPGILIHLFTSYFTRRVSALRHVMHQASNEDYDFKEIVRGDDELSEAFSDLEVMVQRIKEKDALMYRTMLNEQELVNEQQKMEFKMLASQINPHFLYNTLETIRMKAYTAGDREAATAIKLLGKSMRYVLENSGTAFTSLQEELSHIEIYMKIQKLRFGEKFDYAFVIGEGIDVSKCITLPLLLQPVVENAILHGLEERETGGMVTIRIMRAAERREICIEVSDNGCGMKPETLERLRANITTKNPEKKGSIGLYNINQRVKLCYGNMYGMTVDSERDRGTTITLHLPEKVYHDI
ncbi:MAG: sensor histidine kinase [Lachnospiraceae bacterium]|jgi:two-component system sensor histidine kinase YesM|nr:sensor histidine kinase [Lachnospiraceae bacterium]